MHILVYIGGFDYGPFPSPAVSLPVTLPAGQVETVLGIQIREDAVTEPLELFTVSLTIPRFQSGVALGKESNAVVTLVDQNGQESFCYSTILDFIY